MPREVKIVSLEDEENKPQNPDAPQGITFWFGEKGVIKFEDNTEYVVRENRQTVTDERTLANLRLKSKDACFKIFEEKPE